MTRSTKNSHGRRYEAAMNKFVEVDEEAVDDIYNYVEWLKLQITTKRKTIQALNAELDELRPSMEASS